MYLLKFLKLFVVVIFLNNLLNLMFFVKKIKNKDEMEIIFDIVEKL